MAESKPDNSASSVLHNEKHHHDNHKETHGLRDDIDVSTSMSDVKAPNVFERAKEEFEALVEAIHPKKDSKRESGVKDRSDSGKSELHSENDPNSSVKAKEGNEALGHKSHHHHKETHGMSYDIDENTPISEVKGPNVFERAKEEIEALIQTIHPRKDSRDAVSSPKKEGGLPATIGRGLEKICSPRGHNKD